MFSIDKNNLQFCDLQSPANQIHGTAKRKHKWPKRPLVLSVSVSKNPGLLQWRWRELNPRPKNSAKSDYERSQLLWRVAAPCRPRLTQLTRRCAGQPLFFDQLRDVR